MLYDLVASYDKNFGWSLYNKELYNKVVCTRAGECTVIRCYEHFCSLVWNMLNWKVVHVYMHSYI